VNPYSNPAEAGCLFLHLPYEIMNCFNSFCSFFTKCLFYVPVLFAYFILPYTIQESECVATWQKGEFTVLCVRLYLTGDNHIKSCSFDFSGIERCIMFLP
jgi:hypothetical protein